MSRDLAVLVLRLSGFGLALGHGWGKVSGLATGQAARLVDSVSAIGFPAPLVFAWAAALAEFVGGLCVALGLGTRIAAAFTAFTMLVAAFGRHQAHRHFLSWLGIAPVAEETLKAWGNPELALVYLLAFVTIALIGPGRFSVDARLGLK